MANGRIVRLDTDRGFGFIQQSGKEEEIYFHWSSLSAASLAQLAVGQLVSFEVTSDPRDGLRTSAIRVQLIDDRK